MRSVLQEPTNKQMSKLISVALGSILLLGCDSGVKGAGNSGGPPPPPTCDYEEIEFNDTPDSANFVNILPVLGAGNHICGDLFSWGQGIEGDIDTFYFFLNPNLGQETIYFNFVVETEFPVIPVVNLYRTIYNNTGEPTEDYEVLGIFYGDPTSLVVLDFPLEYEDLVSNDVFLELTAASPYPVGTFDYKIDYWNF